MVRPHVGIGVLAGSTGGPATYGTRLVAALAESDEIQITVVTDHAEAFTGVQGVEILDLPMRGGVDRLRWQYLSLPRALRRLGCGLYHDTKNALPTGLSLPTVVTVHDLAYYRCPESFGLLSRAFLRGATRRAVARATRVVVPSRATAVDVGEIFSGSADKTRVVHHGIDPFPSQTSDSLAVVREKYHLDGPYVLHVGTVQARKNVDLLVQGVRRLRAEGLPHRCVLVGRQGWLAAPALREIRADDTAIWLGEVPSSDLPALYSQAAAFVSPSAYEGFGFTVADALAAGTPTVISAISSLPEICGSAAVQIEDLSESGIAKALGPVLRDATLRSDLAQRGRARAAEFTWERAGRQTLAVYREALG